MRLMAFLNECRLWLLHDSHQMIYTTQKPVIQIITQSRKTFVRFLMIQNKEFHFLEWYLMQIFATQIFPFLKRSTKIFFQHKKRRSI